MNVCLLLDSNDSCSCFSSSKILLFDKGCFYYTSTVPKDKYEKFSANCFKISTFIQHGATLSFGFDIWNESKVMTRITHNAFWGHFYRKDFTLFYHCASIVGTHVNFMLTWYITFQFYTPWCFAIIKFPARTTNKTCFNVWLLLFRQLNWNYFRDTIDSVRNVTHVKWWGLSI